MISNHFSRTCRVMLLALPLLMASLNGYSLVMTSTITFGGVSEGAQTFLDGQGAIAFNYTTTGNVMNLSYVSGANNTPGGLQFIINSESSLTMTTRYSKSSTYESGFSGILKGIEVACPEIYGLVIEAYDGETLLGELVYSQKIGYYISGLSYLLQSKQISLKFSAPNSPNGASVYGLAGVTINVDESVYPLNEDKPVTFGASELQTADLTNYGYKGVLFTLNTATDGEGVDEGAICFMTHMTDAKVNQVNNAVKEYSYRPGSPGYAIDFSGGITMMVTKGSGKIVLGVETKDGYAFHVKVGDAEPVEVSSASLQEKEVPYTVEGNTYVYIYLVNKSLPTTSRAGTRIGRRGTAYGKITSVKCASAPPVMVKGDADGNGSVGPEDVQVIADYIMGTVLSISKQADVDGVNGVTLVDLVKVIQIVKAQTP